MSVGLLSEKKEDVRGCKKRTPWLVAAKKMKTSLLTKPSINETAPSRSFILVHHAKGNTGEGYMSVLFCMKERIFLNYLPHIIEGTPSRVMCMGKQPATKQKYERESYASKDVTEWRKRQRCGVNKQEVLLSPGMSHVFVTQEEQKRAFPPKPPFLAGCCYATSNLC